MKVITLANLSESTKQEVFDHVAKHLITQGKRSFYLEDSSPFCAYRGEENTMCAAGCLMTDEEYKLEFEDKSWKLLVEEGFVPSAHMQFIYNLQFIHDSTSSWSDIKTSLKNFADCNELKFNFIS